MLKQRHRNQGHGIGKRPRKSTSIGSILHTNIQTYPQFPRRMQRIRWPFVAMTILPHLERPFVQWRLAHSTILSGFYLCLYIIIYLIHFTLRIPSRRLFTHFYLTFVYKRYAEYFSYPWRCRGSAKAWILKDFNTNFTIDSGLIWAFVSF